MKRLSVVLVLGCLAVLCVGGSSREFTEADIPAELRPVVEGNTAFALELYAELNDGEGNLFFSPYSVSSALAIAYAGARGSTERQMADVLHLPADQAECHDAMAKIRKALVKANGRRGIELNVANGLWPQEGYEFNKAFLRLAKSKYDAHVEFVDFLAPGDGVRSKINAWIEENTNRLIKNAIGRGLLSPATRLVIVNAIYFKGQWVSRFDKAETKPAPFWVSAAESVEAPMMHQEDYFRYGEGEAVQLVELPYGKHDLSMIVLLPKARDNLAERDGLAKLDEQLTPEQLSGWLGGLTVCYVDVLLPKLKIVSSFSLKGALAAMGMPDAFSPADADFTGMTEERPFFIMAVEHAALVDVDEEGTEAAAVTVVTGGCAAAGPPRATFHADHPFVFMIRDNRTGTILFMGRVLDPTR